MVNLRDIGVSAAVNTLSAVGFLVAFAILRLQPINDRVYFPKWYLKGMRDSPTHSAAFASKFINLDCRTYLRFLNWMPAALRMPEPELIDHAGLDSAVYIRIYLLGLKIFVPITALAFVILVPVNWTGGTLHTLKDLTFSNIDKLSLSNVPPGSDRFWAHVAMAYVFSIWTCYSLYMEYKTVYHMRLEFLASRRRHPDEFTVLVRSVPPDPDESVSEHVAHFFRVNHPGSYLTHQVAYNANKLAKLVEKKKSMHNRLIYYQNKYEREPTRKPTTKTGFCGLWGNTVDAIDYYTTEIEKLHEQEIAERDKVLSDPNAVLPAAFVSFNSRWAAAVCAQTQQTSKPTVWLTQWAPEPRDVYWRNLAIPYVEIRVRKLLMGIALFVLIVFSMIPIAFVQSLANVDGIGKVLPFLKPLIMRRTVKSAIAGLLSGIVLKIFIIILPMILMAMSKIEGFTSLSSLEISSAGKFHLFLIINVFFGSIATGTALQQLKRFLDQPPSEIPETVGVSVPMKASFFITYIMIDGWAGVAAEIVRLVPFIIFHLKNTFLVKTEQDRMEALDPGCLNFCASEPRIQLYFLLGLVYAAITPILLPFIIVFFAFAYLVFRHQIINVYDQKYESGAAFWPDVHRRIITALVISQLLLMGLLSTKGAKRLVPFLAVLPILTFGFHWMCKQLFEAGFKVFPLQDAIVKDTLERVTEPYLNLRAYLEDAYVHPIFKGGEFGTSKVGDEDDEEVKSLLVATRSCQMASNSGSLDSIV